MHDLTLYYVDILWGSISEGAAKGIEQIRQDKLRIMSAEDVDKFIDEYALPAQTQMMFNKRMCLVYGVFLKDFVKKDTHTHLSSKSGKGWGWGKWEGILKSLHTKSHQGFIKLIISLP